MRRGRPKQFGELTEEGREELVRRTRRPTTAQALVQRAHIILAWKQTPFRGSPLLLLSLC